jgi:glycosyltransferase involved in cell wall biosynthesis
VRICIIGKFPPIQGGVSAQSYWSAHALARCGHDVHVVTNAKEAVAPFRMLMSAQDWKRCAAAHDSGSVTVHWTDPADHSQSYIPMASPFVSKLAAMAARAHSERPFDVIHSYYLEPYGVAGWIAAQMTGVPHVVRTAGSDAGHLWHHPQLEPLYDHVLRSAAAVVAAGAVAERAVQRGVSPDRIVRGGGFVVPEDLFTPEGPRLDTAALRAEAKADPRFSDLTWGNFAADRPHFGAYGKLGERKGSFALLAAMHRLMSAGVDVGLVVLAHGGATVQRDFRARVEALGLADRVLQIPFLPHWRVPEFLRGCLAVCCLEQGFPIVFHAPMIPREVLLCGTCLVASTELIRKLPSYERLPHGHGCVAIEDVNDAGALSEALATIARNPRAATAIGARGRQFALTIQRDTPFPQNLERTLEAAAMRQKIPHAAGSLGFGAAMSPAESRFPLTQLVAAAIGQPFGNQDIDDASASAGRTIDLACAERILEAVERGFADGRTALEPLAAAVRIELAVAAAEDDGEQSGVPADPLFRLRSQQWLTSDDGLAGLAPVRDPRLRILEFDHDVADFLGARTVADLPAVTRPHPSYVVAFAGSGGGRREPLLVDGLTARILMLSDGKRSTAELARELDGESNAWEEARNLKWIEHLFVCGLIGLRDTPTDTGGGMWSNEVVPNGGINEVVPNGGIAVPAPFATADD